MDKLDNLLKKNWSNWKKSFPLSNRLDPLVSGGLFNSKKLNLYFMINELVKEFCINGVYLEIGIHRGASIICASYKNLTTRCIGIDHFALHCSPGEDTEETFLENQKIYGNKNIEYIKAEALEGLDKLFTNEPDLKIDMFYFDATHDYKSQMASLNKVKSHIKNGGLICIDDLVIKGVSESIDTFLLQNNNFNLMFRYNDNREYWWNGWAILMKTED